MLVEILHALIQYRLAIWMRLPTFLQCCLIWENDLAILIQLILWRDDLPSFNYDLVYEDMTYLYSRWLNLWTNDVLYSMMVQLMEICLPLFNDGLTCGEISQLISSMAQLMKRQSTFLQRRLSVWRDDLPLFNDGLVYGEMTYLSSITASLMER